MNQSQWSKTSNDASGDDFDGSASGGGEGGGGEGGGGEGGGAATTGENLGQRRNSSVESPLSLELKLWKPSWVSGDWIDVLFTADEAGLITIDSGGDETVLYEIGTEPCCAYQSLSTAWSSAQNMFQVNVAEGVVLVLSAATPEAVEDIKHYLNKIITARHLRLHGPTPPERPDKKVKRKSVTERVADYFPTLARLVGVTTRPPVPAKPAFLQRNTPPPPLELDTSSKLWTILHRLREDLPHIPAHLGSLLEAIRAGVRLRTPLLRSRSRPKNIVAIGPDGVISSPGGAARDATRDPESS